MSAASKIRVRDERYEIRELRVRELFDGFEEIGFFPNFLHFI